MRPQFKPAIAIGVKRKKVDILYSKEGEGEGDKDKQIKRQREKRQREEEEEEEEEKNKLYKLSKKLVGLLVYWFIAANGSSHMSVGKDKMAFSSDGWL